MAKKTTPLNRLPGNAKRGLKEVQAAAYLSPNIFAPPREIKEVTAVRLRPSVKAALQKAAQDDARTVNALLEKIAIDWLKAGGYLK